ncbi:MAG: hypothetical protein ACXU8U_06370, partial [Asticcacaulis sp.]
GMYGRGIVACEIGHDHASRGFAGKGRYRQSRRAWKVFSTVFRAPGQQTWRNERVSICILSSIIIMFLLRRSAKRKR